MFSVVTGLLPRKHIASLRGGGRLGDVCPSFLLSVSPGRRASGSGSERSRASLKFSLFFCLTSLKQRRSLCCETAASSSRGAQWPCFFCGICCDHGDQVSPGKGDASGSLPACIPQATVARRGGGHLGSAFSRLSLGCLIGVLASHFMHFCVSVASWPQSEKMGCWEILASLKSDRELLCFIKTLNNTKHFGELFLPFLQTREEKHN